MLLTPPYHPELQPIEKLWRDVKMFVAREFAGTRKMSELWVHVLEGFKRYGGANFCARRVAKCWKFVDDYATHGCFGDAPLADDDEDEDEDECAGDDGEQAEEDELGDEEEEEEEEETAMNVS